MYVFTLVVSIIGALGALFGLLSLLIARRKFGMTSTFWVFGVILAFGLAGNFLAAVYSLSALTT